MLRLLLILAALTLAAACERAPDTSTAPKSPKPEDKPSKGAGLKTQKPIGKQSKSKKPGGWQPVSSPELRTTSRSIALTFMVSHSSLELAGALRRSIPFDLAKQRVGRWRLIIIDANKRRLSVPTEVLGLLPKEQSQFADKNGELRIGDQVESLRVPVIAVIPDAALPLTARLQNPEGQTVGECQVKSVRDKGQKD